MNLVHSDRLYLTPDEEFRRLWNLQAIRITAVPVRAMSATESAFLEGFHTSFRIQDRRRVVSGPRKQGVVLPNNTTNAARRLSNLRERLDKIEALKEIYYVKIVDYVAKEQVEVATLEDSTTVFYLPLRAVKKVKIGRTNWRIVLHASSHESSEPSLNDVLEMGPKLLPEILAILLRFIVHNSAIVGDVRPAFLQLVL